MTLKGHSASVEAVAISADGTRIASGSCDSTLRIWNASSGDSVAVLQHPYNSAVAPVTFSPDGERILSCSSNTALLWDVTTGQEVSRSKARDWSIASVESFSPDGARIASVSYDHIIRIWDATTGSTLLTLEGHPNIVFSVAFSSDGNLLTSGSYDHNVRVWALTDGACIMNLEGHDDGVLAVAISPDGLQIASGSIDKTLRIWVLSSGDCAATLRGHTREIGGVAFSPDGSRVVSGSLDRSVRIWDATTYHHVATFWGHSSEVRSVVFSRDNRHIASGSRDRSIKIWDASATCEDEGEGSPTISDGVVSLAFSSDGSRLAVLTSGPMGRGPTVHVRDPTRPQGPSVISFQTGWHSIVHDARYFPMRFSGGDTRIVITSISSTYIYDALDGQRLAVSDIPDSEHPLFTLQDENVLRHDTSPPTIACILSPSFQGNAVASLKEDGEAGYRVLVGCHDGRILTLHIT